MRSISRTLLTILVLTLTLAQCSSDRQSPQVQATVGHGKDFPDAAVSAVQLRKTTFREVEQAFGKTAVSQVDLHNTYVQSGENSFIQVLSFAYSPSNSCYPEKWAELYFRNGVVEAYSYFNGLAAKEGRSPDLNKVNGLRPGITTRQRAIASLGPPNAETTGRQTIRTDLPGTVAYLWIDSVAPHWISTLTINFNDSDYMVGRPVIDHSGKSVNSYPLQGRWICPGAPPVP